MKTNEMITIPKSVLATILKQADILDNVTDFGMGLEQATTITKSVIGFFNDKELKEIRGG